MTETVPADSSAYFSPSLEGCARKARTLPKAEGKGYLKLEDAFVENHPFFKSRTKCLRGNLFCKSVNETCAAHFSNQHGNGLFCDFYPAVKLDETICDLDHNFIR